MTPAPASDKAQISPRATSVSHAWLTEPVHRQLVLEASRHGLHPDRLTAAIVESVVINGIVDTVIELGDAKR